MVDRSLTKFNKVKCKVLHLGRNSPRTQYMLRSDQLESSLAEKDLVILLDTRLNTSQQCALSAKQANGCTRQNTDSRERILPLCSTLNQVVGSPVQDKSRYTELRLV